MRTNSTNNIPNVPNNTSPPAESFLDAMDRLNRAYPPNTVRQGRQNFSQVPLSSTSTTSNSQSKPVASGSGTAMTQVAPRSLQSTTPSQPLPNRPINHLQAFRSDYRPGPASYKPGEVPKITMQDYYQYAVLAKTCMNQIIKDWNPHPLSPQELSECRALTESRIQKIRRLEARQAQIFPVRERKTEDALWMARLEYRLHFPRIFRISDLPTEIIANIFHYVVWSCREPQDGILARATTIGICRHWRTVALGDPTIWNAIWFRDRPHYERSWTWFDRAGTAPLDIRIGDTKQEPMSLQAMEELLNKLFAKLSYIRILVIVVQDWDPALLVLDKLRNVARDNTPLIMERFEMHRAGSPYVQMGDGYEPSFYLQPMALFGGAAIPSFQYFSVNGIHVDWMKSQLVNLTTLDIRRIPLERAPTLSQFRGLLSNSPGLRKLILDGAGPQWQLEEATTYPPIVLHNLRIMVLGDFSMSYGVYILSQISAPHVLDVTLMNLTGEDYSPFFTALHTPELKLLCIYNVEIIPSPKIATTMVKWLVSMPLLTYLRISNVQEMLIDFFLYDPQSEERAVEPPARVISPKLAFLEWQTMNPMVVARWTAARRRIGAPLRKMYVLHPMNKNIDESQHAALSEAINPGQVLQLPPGARAPEEEALRAGSSI